MSMLKRLERSFKEALSERVRRWARLNRVTTPIARRVASLEARLELLEAQLEPAPRPISTSDAAGRYLPRLQRDDFGAFFNAIGFRGVGAEIGVQYGAFSAQILRSWRGERLISIDPWRYFDTAAYRDQANVGQIEQDAIFAAATAALAQFGERSEIRRQTSAEAAPGVSDGSLDFAYIDAQHQYEAVKEDLSIWWPKIRQGGCLSGHDYLDVKNEEIDFGVKTAVDEFAAKNGRAVHTTSDGTTWLIFR